ncbi:transposase (fragment) [Paraburkholderia piptadeniae]|uniref:Transposase n=1 Tax=Paraburkholderia piptadeniae TaxID=1701573 RepID=A0A1N7SPH2_9BURK
MDFKNFHCARIILSGIETIHMIRKRQPGDDGRARTVDDQFHFLVI